MARGGRRQCVVCGVSWGTVGQPVSYQLLGNGASPPGQTMANLCGAVGSGAGAIVIEKKGGFAGWVLGESSWHGMGGVQRWLWGY